MERKNFYNLKSIPSNKEIDEIMKKGNQGIPPEDKRGYPQGKPAAHPEDTPNIDGGDTPKSARNDENASNKRKTIVYIAGPYRGKTEWETTLNIRIAELAAAHYWREGYTVICPHKNSGFMGGVVPDEEILAGDIEILKRCDMAVFITGYRESEGSMSEYITAINRGIYIEYFDICMAAIWQDFGFVES